MKYKQFNAFLFASMLVISLLLLGERHSRVSPIALPLPIPARLPLLENTPPPALSARAFISLLIPLGGQPEILVEKNAHLRWPIASITKLFTASVVTARYSLDQDLTFTKADLPESVDSGYFRPGDHFRIGDLLVPLLLESSNNAAFALSRFQNQKSFIREMNNLAQRLGLRDTKLFNPSGLDPTGDAGVNYSSAYDLALLGQWLIPNHPELLALTRLPGMLVRQSNGSFHHEARSTNELLLTEPWSGDIVGGKTGSTDLAGKNLFLIIRAPNDAGYLVNIILGSPDHFSEMRQLVDWVRSAYLF